MTNHVPKVVEVSVLIGNGYLQGKFRITLSLSRIKKDYS